MDDFELEIKREFINEALSTLEEAEGSFMELEGAADAKPLLDRIFRLAHNLKGGSRAVGFGQVAEFTHQLENLVLKLQKGELALSSPIVTTLLRSNDRLAEMLTQLKGSFEAVFDNADLLAEIQGWLEGKTAVLPPPAAEPEPEGSLSATEENDGETEAPPSSDLFFAAAPAPAPAPTQAQAPAPAAAAASAANKGAPVRDDEVIRVSLSRIDKLNDYVGELIVLQSVIQQQAGAGRTDALQVSLRQMVKLSKDIQTISMGLRMLPVKPLVQKLQRVVRDTAQTLSKEVTLEIEGEGMEMDKSVLDRLSDPLLHILRNAVDHGLEANSVREQAGKPRVGKITLAFANEGNNLVVEVRDDGKGINTEIVRAKAIEKKIISENQPLSERQLINLIFHPGFSTKTETSEISGRGVGMDVVKTNVENVGGQVDVQTVLGKGSVFRLQIPLSLAVIDGLVVVQGKGRYVVPLGQVHETLNLKSQTVFTDKLGIGSCIQLRGQVVPVFSLRELLGQKSEPVGQDGTALIAIVDDRPVGIMVDDVLRAQQIVVKPLANGVDAQRGWIGCCVLGDGLPTLILSPNDMLDGRLKYEINERELGRTA